MCLLKGIVTRGQVVSRLAIEIPGFAALMILGYLSLCGFELIGHRPIDRPMTRLFGVVLLIFSLAGIFNIVFDEETQLSGKIGEFIGGQLVNAFGDPLAVILWVQLATIGVLLSSRFLIPDITFRGWKVFRSIVQSFAQHLT